MITPNRGKEEIALELDEHQIPYQMLTGVKDGFLVRDEVKQWLDEDLWYRFNYDDSYMAQAFFEGGEDKFRCTFWNKENADIVAAMIDHRDVPLKKITSNEFFPDEYYKYRPDMRLIHRIIKEQHRKMHICDLACGHGALIRALQKDGHQVVGVDLSEGRVAYLHDRGVEAYYGPADDSGLYSENYDAVFCLQALEHVPSVLKVLRHAWQLLKPGGVLFCTAPLGAECEATTHVRLFSLSSYYSFFYRVFCQEHKGRIVQLMPIPYVDFVLGDTLFCMAQK